LSLIELRARLEQRRRELRTLRVAVLAGGGSSEREVSLRSGAAVLAALQSAGYDATLLQLGTDNLSLEAAQDTAAQLPSASGTGGTAVQTLAKTTPTDASAIAAIRSAGVVFTMLHGSLGENGAWQGVLELAGVPYVSAGVKGSALAMDKVVSKRLFEQLGVPTPRWWTISKAEPTPQVPESITELVAKPATEGSSVGIAMVENNAAGWERIAALAAQFDPLLVEERIRGRELTVGVIGTTDDPVALPIVEILAGNEFYDYDAKYAGISKYECPAQVDADIAQRISEQALLMYRAFDLGPYARVDCLLSEDGTPYFLEANTLPGFTQHSLLPMAARAAGIEMDELLELLMLCAIERREGQR